MSDSDPAARADRGADPEGAVPSGQPVPTAVPHAGARYASLRLLTLLAAGAVLYLVGLRGWLLAFAAVLVSGLASFFLFMKQRNDAAMNLEHAMGTWKQRRGQADEFDEAGDID